MAVSGEEIRRRLVEFAEKWSLYEGSERAEAQTYLNELFACYGTDRHEVARFEDPQHGRFLDLIWDQVCIIEMKRPSEGGRLPAHRGQALDYWRNSADPAKNLPAPRFVVLCAFRRFEVWEPGAYPNAPRMEFDLVDLPDRADALLFLSGREPVFLSAQEADERAHFGRCGSSSPAKNTLAAFRISFALRSSKFSRRSFLIFSRSSTVAMSLRRPGGTGIWGSAPPASNEEGARW